MSALTPLNESSLSSDSRSLTEQSSYPQEISMRCTGDDLASDASVLTEDRRTSTSVQSANRQITSIYDLV